MIESIFNWFKKPPTLDDIIAASFYEEGRWIEQSTNIWTDTITKATIQTIRGGLYINEVPVSNKVHEAFWDMISAPSIRAEQDKKDALHKLYSGIHPTKSW